MNRKNLTAAILAGLAGVAGIAGTAQAVNVNPDGLGQVLLYPYYTTNDDNITVLSVVNTSEYAKAVKVRFLEGENSREVLDFNMYMSKYDVWTAAIYDDDGTPTMMTEDTTCTVPYIYGAGGVQEFLPWALTDAEYLDKDYKGKQTKQYGDISRGAEGHFEIIEMGTLVNGTEENPKWVDVKTYPICDDVLDASGNPVDDQTFYGHPADCSDPLFPRNWTAAELAEKATLVSHGSATAATHKNGVPNNCAQLVGAWTRGATTKTDGYWITDNFADIEPPSGGLFGGAAVVNIEVGSMYSYDARAIDGFYVDERYDNYVGDDSHQEPGTILPSLDSGNSRDAAIFFDGDTLESGWYGYDLERSVDAVSFVLMHDQIMNEYVTDSAVGAATEWVITFPTKQFYVHQAFLDYYNDKFRGNVAEDYYETDDKYDPSGNLISSTFIPVAPFTSSWTWTNTTYVADASGNPTPVVKKPGYVNYPCEIVQLNSIWDREEGTIVPEDAPPGTPVPPIVSPAPPPATGPSPDPVIPFELCYETSVIAFGDGSNYSILGSANTHTIDNTELGFDSGWARLDLWNASWDSDESGAIDKDEIVFRDDLGGLVGLPVTGFAVTSFVNAFLGDGADVLANYGGIFTHKGTRKIGSYYND